MAILLHIETATQVCSIAVSENGLIKAIKESQGKNSHAEMVTIFAEQVIREAELDFSKLDAIAVSMGPGSYTGLRIGVSTAKGFCLALGKPLIAVSTLQSMAAGMISQYNNSGSKDGDVLFCPMIDARRMEVFTAVFNSKLEIIQDIYAKIIDETSFSALLETKTIIFGGDGADKCKDFLKEKTRAVFLTDFTTSAAYMTQLAENKFNSNTFENVAYFEPFYLKDFVGGIPKVKGLRDSA